MQIQSPAASLAPYKVSNTPPNPSPPPSAPSDGWNPRGWLDPVIDVGKAIRLLANGQYYRSKGNAIARRDAVNPPLQNETPVKIEQPFVMVPGWTTTREAFDPLAEKLLEGGRNGGELVFVQGGDFFYDRDCTLRCPQINLDSGDHKVFEVVWSDIRLPPHLSALELETNLEAVKTLTGAQELDVSAYSMGGLATRKYLDNGGNDIDQLITLGSPHQGAEFADLARRTLRRDLQWAINFAGLLPADLPALDWLAPVERGNPQLEGLNDRWASQKAQVNEVRFVGGIGTVSADTGWWPVADGDGLVTAKSSAPPGETPVILPDQHHSHLNNNALVYEQLRDFFGWQPD